MTGRSRTPKRVSGIVADAPWGQTKSAAQLRAEAPKKFWSQHWIVEPMDYQDTINVGHRFLGVDGRELRSFGEVQGELARAGEKGIESR